MDERQARNSNTTYNGCKMEFWKFALTWKLICPMQHKIIQKREKETTKEGGILGKNIGQQYCWCSLMWLMPLKSLSNCDYELKNLPRLILGPIHSNQVMGMDPVGSYHGTRNSRSNSINPTYPYQLHD